MMRNILVTLGVFLITCSFASAQSTYGVHYWPKVDGWIQLLAPSATGRPVCVTMSPNQNVFTGKYSVGIRFDPVDTKISVEADSLPLPAAKKFTVYVDGKLVVHLPVEQEVHNGTAASIVAILPGNMLVQKIMPAMATGHNLVIRADATSFGVSLGPQTTIVLHNIVECAFLAQHEEGLR